MKATRKLIPAIALLLVSAAMMSTASFAWFSMNNNVKVTGMQVNTKVENNLLIATSTAGTSKSADSAFGNGLNQSVTGNLQPVSTINGVNFFYTNNATANGAAVTGTAFTALSNNQITINSTTYNGYVDYVFEIKAINAGTSATTMNMTKLDLLYNNSAVTAEKAYRVAIFSQTYASGDTYPAFGSAADAIYTMSGAQTFGHTETTESAVSSTTEKGNVTYNGAWSKTIEAGATAYYKITVRLWLEGEDTTCNNTTFMSLTDKWSLDLGFSLGGTAVSNIGTSANATNTLSTDTLTAALASTLSTETVQSYAWYKVGTDTAISDATLATYKPTVTGNYYCVITTTKGNIYTTPAVEVTVSAEP